MNPPPSFRLSGHAISERLRGNRWMLRWVAFARRMAARAFRNGPLWVKIFWGGSKDALWLARFRARQRRRHRTRKDARREERPVTLAFVIPWFGADISGGAESETYGLIRALQKHAPDLRAEVFTTTLHEFPADWDQPVHAEGVREEDGIRVHRFHPDPDRTDRRGFHFLNGACLMQGGTESLQSGSNGTQRSPLPFFAEAYFLRRMVMSTALLRYMEEAYDEYDAFVLIPYMFATTALGCWVAGKKAVLLPCLHDERYAYMNLYARAFAQAGTALCHVRSERHLFSRLYPHAPQPFLLGEQVDTDVPLGDAQHFRDTYDIRAPFLLYAGRQVEGKNLPLLIEYFTQFRKTHPEYAHVQLVLIGKGDLDYSRVPGIVPLGFIPARDKIDAYRAALGLVMLSIHESFSIVIMEAWLQETPVIVSADCAVTRDHVEDSGGGWVCSDADAFHHAVRTCLADPSAASAMGQAGRAYVKAHYTPEQIVRAFRESLHALLGREASRPPPEARHI